MKWKIKFNLLQDVLTLIVHSLVANFLSILFLVSGKCKTDDKSSTDDAVDSRFVSTTHSAAYVAFFPSNMAVFFLGNI